MGNKRKSRRTQQSAPIRMQLKNHSLGQIDEPYIRTLSHEDLMTAMTRLDNYRVLVIDDIGYVNKTDSETQVPFEFIAHRYESGSLMITSNQPFSQWDHIFPDTMMNNPIAAIDRIIHHATIIEIDSESYRRKNQKKS